MKQLPGTNKSEATKGQRAFLERIGKWRDGMTMEEASAVIDSLPKAIPGLHIAKISNIEDNIRDGKIVTDKDGNPSIKITFKLKPVNEGSAPAEISDSFFYSTDPKNKVCKSEWKLRALKSAMGLNVEENTPVEKVKAAKCYIIVQLCEYIDSNGNLITDDNGDVMSFVKVGSRFFSTAQGKPTIDGDPAITGGKPSGVFYETVVKKTYNKPVEAANDDEFADNETSNNDIINDSSTEDEWDD